VEVVQDLVSREAWRELPLAVELDFARIEVSAGVAKRGAGWVVEADGDGVFQEARPAIEAGIEEAGGLRKYPLVPEEGVAMIEGEAMGEWREGARERFGGACWYRGRGGMIEERGEVEGGFSVAQGVESANELDDIAACIAPAEATPEAASAGDDERASGVAFVNRTGTD